MKVSESTAREVLAAINEGPSDERECFWALHRACVDVLAAPAPEPEPAPKPRATRKANDVEASPS